MVTSPVRMDVNTPRRFYRGGEHILKFRGLPLPDDFDAYRPEDWLGSTTRLFAEGGDGLTTLGEGRTLRSVLAEQGRDWLGDAHLERYGAEPGLLVKLLDAAERLPVHVHPDRTFAARHLDCPHGKTEAWLILDADPGAQVWLGFRDDISEERLTALVDAQDERLLDGLNPFTVERGDVVLVPAGQPHAIGAGVFAVELQEPTDFSVMLEHARFGLPPEQSWLGLARSTALTSVERRRLEPEALASLRRRWDHTARSTASVLPSQADDFFRAEVLDGHGDAARTDAGFSVIVVVEGSGRLTTGSGDDRPVRAGETLLTPYSCGDLTVRGPVTMIRCRPGATTQTTSGASAPDRTIEEPEEQP